MKKYFAFALAAATLLVSCQKENNVTEITPEPEFLTVTIQKDPETRTYIDHDNCVYWNENLTDYVWFAFDNGQQIACRPVSVNNNYNTQKSSATFKIPIDQASSRPSVLYAAYPVPRGLDDNYPYSVNNENITFEIPEVQTGSFAGANISVAKTKINTGDKTKIGTGDIYLYFHNVTAILRFTRGSNPATSLLIKNNAPISGQFTAELGFDDNGYGIISNVLPPSSSGANDGQITITPPVNNNDNYYYVTVGPCTMNSNTHFIWTEGGERIEVQLQNTTDLKYNRIYKLGDFNSNGGSTSGDEYYFTINASGKKVVLAPGNLWKDESLTSREVYGFNDHQYDNISSTAFYTNQKRDKFNWSEEFKVTNPPTTWNINHKTWYALYDAEWMHIFSRDNYHKVGFGQITISQGDSKKTTYTGLFILPDNFTDPNMNLNPENTSFVPNIIDHTINYLTANNPSANQYDNDGWAAMEAKGVVFLPATGYGKKAWTSPTYVDDIRNTACGYYWTQNDPGITQHWGHFFFCPSVGSFVVNVNDAWMNIRPARDYVSKGDKDKTNKQ